MLTPLPNLTVYYTGYRIYSHFRALQGAKALDHGLAQLNSRQLRDLREQVQCGGVCWGVWQEVRMEGQEVRIKELEERIISLENMIDLNILEEQLIKVNVFR